MTTLPHGRNLLGCDHGMGVGVLNSRRDDTINRGALDSSITEVRKCVAACEVVVMMKSGSGCKSLRYTVRKTASQTIRHTDRHLLINDKARVLKILWVTDHAIVLQVACIVINNTFRSILAQVVQKAENLFWALWLFYELPTQNEPMRARDDEKSW